MPPVPEITGKTVFIPLIGHPVEQVKSPGPVNAWFSDNDVGAVLIPVDIFPEKVPAFLDAIRGTPNCPGVSVTMPHKQAACAGVDELTERARRAEAVNIIRRNADGTLVGDMVDGDAMVAALAKNGSASAARRFWSSAPAAPEWRSSMHWPRRVRRRSSSSSATGRGRIA